MVAGRDSLNVSTLEGWLWDAACIVRGPLDAPKFKDYILPLIFLKRLSDVFEDEVDRLAKELGDEGIALQVVEEDRTMVRFFIPTEARWPEIRQKTTGLAEHLTDAVRAVAVFRSLLRAFLANPIEPGQRGKLLRKSDESSEILILGQLSNSPNLA